jgi:uncharacterized membrane protein YeaQ/YmgE (transglycosylase-associated protein family)
MNIITSLVVGALIGWVASMLMQAAGREDLIRNIALGIAGAYIGRWILSALIESNQGGFSFGVVVASFLGAATLLFIVTRLSRA